MSAVTTLDRAAFIVSIDTEMAWGMVHRREVTYRYDEELEHIQRLIDLFDEHEIPATWAIVGHLFLDRCQPVDGVKHPEIVRPDYDWFDGDWFDDDPCSDSTADPTWYAPGVIERIREGRSNHEIASHGFSHLMAGDPGCSRETFASEMRAARSAADAAGVDLRSLVYPRNSLGHVDVLREQGFSAYRGSRPRTAPPSAGQRMLDKLVGSERTVVRPIDEDGIWNLPATIMFDVDERPRSWRVWTRQVERRLEQAVAHRGLFHLWFHPHNFRANPERSFEALDRILVAASVHRETGKLEATTMGSLAESLSNSNDGSAV